MKKLLFVLFLVSSFTTFAAPSLAVKAVKTEKLDCVMNVTQGEAPKAEIIYDRAASMEISKQAVASGLQSFKTAVTFRLLNADGTIEDMIGITPMAYDEKKHLFGMQDDYFYVMDGELAGANYIAGIFPVMVGDTEVVDTTKVDVVFWDYSLIPEDQNAEWPESEIWLTCTQGPITK